jgi:sortase (surface protein transpeptidase)
MKYFFLGIFSGLFLLVFIQNIGSIYGVNTIPTLLPTNSLTEIPTPTLAVRPDIPMQLIIPKLNINTEIEQVGYDQEGKVDTPISFANVGWFSLGVRPGEKGNAVIDGHFDTFTGSPAVFYNLSSLNIGDEIEVIDSQKQIYTFSVVDKKEFPHDQFPLTQVFGKNNGKMLNLITCEGTWDYISRNYSNRLVIFSKLIE